MVVHDIRLPPGHVRLDQVLGHVEVQRHYWQVFEQDPFRLLQQRAAARRIRLGAGLPHQPIEGFTESDLTEIGRASCRERVWIPV